MAKKILIADDYEPNRILLSAQLEMYAKQPCEVILAEDGKTALELICDKNPDFAILDNVMPYLTGLQVIACARGRSKTLPMIVYTSSKDSKKQCEAQGIRAFLKPEESEAMFDYVNNTLFSPEQ